MENKDKLLEWYEGDGGENPTVVVAEKPADNHSVLGFTHPSLPSTEQKPEQDNVKAIENYSELYKAVVITRALENKILMLSDIFNVEADKKEALKKEIKELAAMITKVVNGI